MCHISVFFFGSIDNDTNKPFNLHICHYSINIPRSATKEYHKTEKLKLIVDNYSCVKMTNQFNLEISSSFTHCKQIDENEMSIYYKLQIDRVEEELKIKPQTRIEHRGRALAVNEVYTLCLKNTKHLHYFTCGEHVFHLEKLDRFEHNYE